MSNLQAKISSSAAEARSQAALSERIVKLEQELAELQTQSQLDKAELDAMEMVDQVGHYNQVKSKSIISQSADLQNYSSGIGSQHPQGISYSVPVSLKSEVITSGYNYSPLVSSSVSPASNVTSLASGYTSSSMSVQPAIGSRSSVNHGASYSVPTSHQSNFHGSCPCINPVNRSHLDDARLSSQAPICHTGDGNYLVVLLHRTLVMFPKSIGLISHSLAVFHIRIMALVHNKLFQDHTLILVMYHNLSSFNLVIIPVHQLVAGLYLNLISFNLVIIPVRHLVAGLYLNFVSSLVKIFPIFWIIPLGVIHSKL